MPAMPSLKVATDDAGLRASGAGAREMGAGETQDDAAMREEEIRLAQQMLFFAYRDFTRSADLVLEELGMGRAHHRALHFIGRHPGITVSDLLSLLGITKQSLARVLSALLDQEYVIQEAGTADRRQRLLTLTEKGAEFERRLFERQRDKLSAAFAAAGTSAVDGFRRVMRQLMDEQAKLYLDRGNPRLR